MLLPRANELQRNVARLAFPETCPRSPEALKSLTNELKKMVKGEKKYGKDDGMKLKDEDEKEEEKKEDKDDMDGGKQDGTEKQEKPKHEKKGKGKRSHSRM